MSDNKKYEDDVAFEVWKRGGNPDFVDRDRCLDYEDMGYTTDEAAKIEYERQYPKPEGE